MMAVLPSLGPKLDGARAKVRRANEHIRALKLSMKRFATRDPYAIGVDHYESDVILEAAQLKPAAAVFSPSGLILPQSEPEVLISSLAVSISLMPRPDRPTPSLRWGVLVGEVVHNLASALDNLVFELAEANPNPPPAPTNSQQKQLHARRRLSQGFPYCEKANEWANQIDRYLFFVDRAIDPVFREAQPFYVSQKLGIGPEHYPLAVVHNLWNRDKHRAVNLATAGLEFNFTNVRIPSLFPVYSNLKSKIVKTFPMRPIEGKTEVAVILVQLPKKVEAPPKIDVFVKPNFTLAMVFGEGAPGEGQDVLDMLQAARDKVLELLGKFS